jgi:hypothetical protein
MNLAENCAHIKRTLGIALGMATAFSCWVVLLSVLRGSTVWDEYHATTFQIIAGYYGGAFAAGIAVGCLWSLTQGRAGAMFVGAIGGTVVYAAVAFAGRFGSDAILMAPIPGTMCGGALAYQLWTEAHPNQTDHTARRLTILAGSVITLLIIVALGLALRH